MSVSIASENVLQWDEALIQKYNVTGPRYTSYPTAKEFDDGLHDLQRIHTEAAAEGDLSLYVHIPFCRDICYYCGCNKVVTRKPGQAETYLSYIFKEIAQVGGHYSEQRQVTQLHWGGGTPTYLNHQQLTALMTELRRRFSLLDSAAREFSIEVDPRTLAVDSMPLLKSLGFNRLSMGIQDFDPVVQQAINRMQSVEMVSRLVDSARDNGFGSISFDLIYGLPHQTVARFEKTLDQVLRLSPERISCYSYAHLPDIFKSQRSIDRLAVPSGEERLALMQYITQRLEGHGYLYIGMDHFVRPEDSLAVARNEGRLQRNFQGYSTLKADHLVGLGVSAISSSDDYYVQNVRELQQYYQRIDAGQWALQRGLQVNDEDRLRRAVIMALICNMRLNYADIEARFAIDFKQHFAAEIDRLAEMAADSLLELSEQGIRILPIGRVLIRTVCMVFDQYLSAEQRYSKTI